MKIRFHFTTLVLLGTATLADGQIQPQVARQWFAEAMKLCERDAGRLWGVSLCGPMVIVDQRSGTRATSQTEPQGPVPRFQGFVAQRSRHALKYGAPIKRKRFFLWVKHLQQCPAHAPV